MTNKLQILSDSSFGDRVAEQEADSLAGYFVETDLWRTLYRGEIDLILGAKGAGKSALYATLLGRASELERRERVHIRAAENAIGSTVFSRLQKDAPTDGDDYKSLWKLYVLTLVGVLLVEQDVNNKPARRLKDALVAEGLLDPRHSSLADRLGRVLAAVKRLGRIQKSEAEMKLDPGTGMPVGIATSFTLAEPDVEDEARGILSLDAMIGLANEALEEADLTAWILFDRLDVAFANSPEAEGKGLRALIQAYLDVLGAQRIKMKFFLRSDIWNRINRDGFIEASHVTRRREITWSNRDLLNLVASRLASNEPILRHVGLTHAEIFTSLATQRSFFDSLVPPKIDAGKNPPTFEWMLGRAQDGSGQPAPREVIHLLSEARLAQIEGLEGGEEEPSGKELIGQVAFRSALGPVSQARVEQTLYAEYPQLRVPIESLRREKAEQRPESLARIWAVSEEEARQTAQQLVEIGFFESRGPKHNPRYWAPFLYRPYLKLVQGVAE